MINKLKYWLNLLLRKKVTMGGITVRCKSRKTLKEVKKLHETFNVDLYIQDKYFEEIVSGFCVLNFDEAMKNDRYKLD